MEGKKKKSVASVLIDGVAGIFLPIVNLMTAAGILKGVLAILTAAELTGTESETYLVLNAMADGLFYFLPVLLAFTAAAKFGANQFTAVVIAGILLYPSLTAALEPGHTIHFLGLSLRGVTYHSSVIPIILAVGLLHYVEKFLNRIIPEMIKGFVVPLVSILLVSLVTLSLFGPLGAVIGDVLAVGYEHVYTLSPIAAGIFLGVFTQPMVIFGFQWSFILIAMNNIMVNGSDTVLALMGPAAFSQAGAVFAVLLKSKDRAFQSICGSAMLSALFGITEPALFGVSLPRKKPMIGVCVGGGIGGALAGFSGAHAMSFAFPSLVTFPVFYGEGFGMYVVSCLAGFAVSFLITMVLKVEEQKEQD